MLFAGIMACSTGDEKDSAAAKEKALQDSLAACSKPVFDEYKASELAVLMRKMDADMNTLRDKILHQQFSSDSLQFDYSNIKTATPTDPTVKTDIFAGMADAFLLNMEKLKSHGGNDPGSIFNAAVSSCLTCHEQFCPGPMVRIRKLKI